MEVLTWQARNKRGLTLKQLEAATGIGKTTLNNIENGLVSPTLNQLEAIARALDVKMSDLYDSVYKEYSRFETAEVGFWCYLPKSGNRYRSHLFFHNLRYNGIRGKVMRMDIRQKIDALLRKITSEDQLKRIYRFIKYIYIHTPK